jgi:hypothetical protein
MGEVKRKRKYSRKIKALKVTQWLDEWDKTVFDEKTHRSRPSRELYLFSIPAFDLKALTGVYRRETEEGKPRHLDLGIQRILEEERVDEIRDFIHYGYPWSELSDRKRESGEFDDLRKPGWLPTAIVVNILKKGDKRRDKSIAGDDVITIEEVNGNEVVVNLPKEFGSNWKPTSIYPIEVIDGQHRLWAFEKGDVKGDFELPVVAFYGLDISWEAYLFWTINIKPKRINPSLAFDLYPLLRTEDWLEKFAGHSIYRDTRAQELTEALWAHNESPWYNHINMLGDRSLKKKMVSQSAWVRSLTATYIKSWEGGRGRLGGLFGAPIGEDTEVLPWTRAQQAAFLILMGQEIRGSVRKVKYKWAESLRTKKRNGKTEIPQEDPAFFGPHTMLNTDQGIRGLLYITNDLCYVRAKELKLNKWTIGGSTAATDIDAVNEALTSLKEEEVSGFLKDIAKGLAEYDWRVSSAPGLSESERLKKGAFRGGGGYKELRIQLLKHLSVHGTDIVISTAKDIIERLGY